MTETRRFMEWANAFARERRAARELAEAYVQAHDETLAPAERPVARRALGRANTRHCAAMRSERAARSRLSRADHQKAIQFATQIVEEA